VKIKSGGTKPISTKVVSIVRRGPLDKTFRHSRSKLLRATAGGDRLAEVGRPGE
jgi:hypothetical protein